MIHVFCEGRTEQSVVDALGLQKTVHPLAIKLHDGGGKRNVNRKIHTILGAELGKANAKVRSLILRDLDEGEKQEDIVKSITNQLQKTLAQRGYKGISIELTPDSDHDNVHLLNLTTPNLRVALHIATLRLREDFANATIDDYVLRVALEKQTITKLLAKKGWNRTTPEQIIRKVSTKIPDLLEANGIPLREAKDYVRLYAALMQMHTSPAVFARKILANALPEHKEETFASLLAAFRFVVETS